MTANNENIVFGKFDATANDVPYMFPPLKGYPSIFFLSAYEKFDPIQYQGDRTYKSVKDWINRHSSIFLSEEERTGQAAEDDEEIESFTAENFEADVATDGETTQKDELWKKTPKFFVIPSLVISIVWMIRISNGAQMLIKIMYLAFA